MNKKIMIVDDEQNILDILEKFLSRNNQLEIQTYTNPTAALSAVKSNPCDLILLDVMMPQMDGMEFLKQTKEFNSNIKVIMMTAYSTMDKMIDSQKIGANDYVTKPFISLRDVENKVLDQLGD